MNKDNLEKLINKEDKSSKEIFDILMQKDNELSKDEKNKLFKEYFEKLNKEYLNDITKKYNDVINDYEKYLENLSVESNKKIEDIIENAKKGNEILDKRYEKIINTPKRDNELNENEDLGFTNIISGLIKCNELISKIDKEKDLEKYIKEINKKINFLIKLGRLKEAMECCEQSLNLRKDSIIQSKLMCLYGILEKYENVQNLLETTDDGFYKIMLPYAIIQYKQSNYNKSKIIIEELYKAYSEPLKNLIEENYYHSISNGMEEYNYENCISVLLCQVPNFVDFIKNIIENIDDTDKSE